AIINSTIFPNMNFTKTSQKFGQWSDPKVNSVYGLGFPTEAELNKDDREAISHKPVGNTEAQLKYENDRLKMALAQSSTNSKKWETELQTLKNNNARLTAALQESTANVEEWKKQLNAYKEESIRLRKKVQEMESSDVNADMFNSVQQDKMALEGRIIHLESVARDSEEELTLLKHTNNELHSQVKVCREENEGLQQKMKGLEDKLAESSLMSSAQQFKSLHEAIKSKLDELNTLNDSIPTMVNNC
ncbi:hypothetical protein QZH41_015307, partial [Actinostola sp. cb2023]